MFRDKSMNALTRPRSCRRSAAPVRPSRATTAATSSAAASAGRSPRTRRTSSPPLERTQQDTTQAVNTQGLFPDQDGIFAVPVPREPVTGKVTANLSAAQYLSVRYGRNNNSQPYGAAPNSTPDNWGDSKNKFNSINLNHNWVLGGSKLNEFIFQFADFSNHIAARSVGAERDASRTA